MKSKFVAAMAALLILQSAPVTTPFKTALTGYRYEFPRDHFSHPDFQTEWWYYTGNLRTEDGHRFGFELTFFREAVDRDAAKNATWDLRDIYLAHLALSDLDGGAFYHAERTNRNGPGIAGVDASAEHIWNGNWSCEWSGDDQKLQAVDDRFTFGLRLHPEKPPVIQGENGVSQKAAGVGHASHYISFTRLSTSGSITLQGKTYNVSGLSWMDHEFFTHQLEADQVGWDWLSLQLDDDTELMLFRIRRKDGSVDPFSAGTFVDREGKSQHLRASDFSLAPQQEFWERPDKVASYPIHWKITIPAMALALDATTLLAPQELPGNSKYAPNYWEGAIVLKGQKKVSPVTGVGYLEMTGYDHAVQLGQ
jgi:predicted secreted hydrolase